MMALIWLVFHLMGLDSASDAPYLLWSGFGSDLGLFTGMMLAGSAWWHRHNCHAPGCWKIGRFPIAGGAYTMCLQHHPDHQGQVPTLSHMHRMHWAIRDREERANHVAAQGREG